MGSRAKREDSPYRHEARQLGHALRAARESRGLGREALAHLAGVSVSTIQKIEMGPIVDPGFFTVRSLAVCLGVTLADLDPTSEQDG